VTPFLESPRFPGCPSFGFQFRPRFNTEKIVNAAGRELRFQFWDYPLHDCQVTVGPRKDDEIDEILAFFYAVGGEYYGFRFKNHGEFKTCKPSETPAGTDQPTLAGSVANTYQLIKRYTAGSNVQNRPIYKPVASSLLIYDGGVPASNYTVNATTGLITFTVAPSGAVTWGGEFDVPMRFSGDFPIQIIDKRAHTVSFMLEELR
jgi:uncharacterized protein (TIGR02217 family)